MKRIKFVTSEITYSFDTSNDFMRFLVHFNKCCNKKLNFNCIVYSTIKYFNFCEQPVSIHFMYMNVTLLDVLDWEEKLNITSWISSDEWELILIYLSHKHFKDLIDWQTEFHVFEYNKAHIENKETKKQKKTKKIKIKMSPFFLFW